MFKGFQNTNRNHSFNGFPNINFGMNKEAFGFGNCTFWLSAEYGLPTQTDGANIASWTDRIKGISFLQATGANQPIYRASDVNFNNYPCIEVQTSDTMISPQAVGISYPFTIAIVYKADSIGSANYICDDNLAGGVTIQAAGTTGNITGFGVYTAGGTFTPSLVTTVEDTVAHIGIITNGRIIVDGVEEITGTSAQFGISRIGIASANSLKGKITDIIIYNNDLTSSECVALSDNINSKYAIY